jgi:hypothetical protein
VTLSGYSTVNVAVAVSVPVVTVTVFSPALLNGPPNSRGRTNKRTVMVLPLMVGLPSLRTPRPLMLTVVVSSNVQFEPVIVIVTNRGKIKPELTVFGLSVIAHPGAERTVKAF